MRKQTGLDRAVLATHFDAHGRLFVCQAAERTLQKCDQAHAQRFAAMPRALRSEDLGRLSQVLKDNPGVTDTRLRQLARAAGVPRPVLTYLFVPHASLRDRLATRPEDQHATRSAVHTRPQTPPAPLAPPDDPAGPQAPAPTRRQRQRQQVQTQAATTSTTCSSPAT